LLKTVLAALLLVVPVSPAAAQSADVVNANIEMVLGDHTLYEEAFTAIQTAVAENDSEAVAAWVAYPFAATIDGDAVSIEGPDGFIEHYDSIVTDEVMEAVTGQSYEDLFVNAEGIMFGNGQMWLNGVCKDDSCAEFDVRIITIQSTETE